MREKAIIIKRVLFVIFVLILLTLIVTSILMLTDCDEKCWQGWLNFTLSVTLLIGVLFAVWMSYSNVVPNKDKIIYDNGKITAVFDGKGEKMEYPPVPV